MAEPEKPVLDQYYPGGAAQQGLDWNVQQHQEMGGGDSAGPIQNWGVVAATSNSVTVTFDKPYTAPPVVTTADTTTTHSKLTSVTATDFSLTGQGDVHWFAIGT